MELYFIKMDFTANVEEFSYKGIVLAETVYDALAKFNRVLDMGKNTKCTDMQIHLQRSEVHVCK